MVMVFFHFSWRLEGAESLFSRQTPDQKRIWFKLVQQSKEFFPGSLVGAKDIDFVGRSEAETP